MRNVIQFRLIISRTSYTLYISIAREVLRTEANASVRCGFTLRVEAASGCQAGIHASSVQALLMISAILIQVTLHVAQDCKRDAHD